MRSKPYRMQCSIGLFFRFRLVSTLVLHEKELHINITLHNTSKELPFSFMLGLTHYLRVPDVTQCELLGVQGCPCLENDSSDKREFEKEALKIEKYTNILFLDTPNEFFITNTMDGDKYRIEKKNFSEIFVWNPWIEQAKSIKDISDEEYSKMFYFVAGMLHKLQSLAPGGTFEAKVVLSNCRKIASVASEEVF